MVVEQTRQRMTRAQARRWVWSCLRFGALYVLGQPLQALEQTLTRCRAAGERSSAGLLHAGPICSSVLTWGGHTTTYPSSCAGQASPSPRRATWLVSVSCAALVFGPEPLTHRPGCPACWQTPSTGSPSSPCLRGCARARDAPRQCGRGRPSQSQRSGPGWVSHKPDARPNPPEYQCSNASRADESCPGLRRPTR